MGLLTYAPVAIPLGLAWGGLLAAAGRRARVPVAGALLGGVVVWLVASAAAAAMLPLAGASERWLGLGAVLVVLAGAAALHAARGGKAARALILRAHAVAGLGTVGALVVGFLVLDALIDAAW